MSALLLCYALEGNWKDKCREIVLVEVVLVEETDLLVASGRVNVLAVH